MGKHLVRRHAGWSASIEAPARVMASDTSHTAAKTADIKGMVIGE